MNHLMQHMAVEAERRLVQGQAERGSRVAEIRAAAPVASGRLDRARWVAGSLLLRAGAHLQGAARTEPALTRSAA